MNRSTGISRHVIAVAMLFGAALAGFILAPSREASACAYGNLTSISPSSGTAGTSVTITGNQFVNCGGATAVKFGGVAASFTVTNNTSITATAPAGSGTVDVVVTFDHGAATSDIIPADQFTYTGGGGSGAGNNTIAQNLGQSSHYVAHYIAGASTGSFSNDVWTQAGTLFGEDTAGGSAIAANGGGGSGAAGNSGALNGFAGSNPATRPNLLQLAQLAQGFYRQATSGGGLFSGGKQLAAASPGPLAFGSNQPFGGFLRANYTGLTSSQAGAQFGGSVQTYTGAVDYKFAPDWVGGIALDYETGSINTSYNLGRLSDTGVTIGPYVAWRFAPHFVWDAMIGMGWLNYNATQNATVSSSGKFNATRYVAASDVTGSYAFGNFSVRPTVGALTVFELDNGFVDSTNTQQSSSSVRIGRLKGGGEVGYNIPLPNCPVTIAPFGKALLQYDLLHDGRPVTANGTLVSETTASGVLGGGIDAQYKNLVLLRLEGGYDTIGASNVSQWNAAAQLRVNLPF